jgi:hypothetical protein
MLLKRLGDGLMALFGYPQAQENDAERARAALATQRALVEINARNSAKGEPELSARIGLESGPVVVEARVFPKPKNRGWWGGTPKGGPATSPTLKLDHNYSPLISAHDRLCHAIRAFICSGARSLSDTIFHLHLYYRYETLQPRRCGAGI